MKKRLSFLSLLFFTAQITNAQVNGDNAVAGGKTNIIFVSDTQKPMMVEKLVLKPNHNSRATSLEFSEILQKKPGYLYMLGDVVALGASNRQWKKVDKFLDVFRKQGSTACAVLGNHEVMFNKTKGEANFNKRFPMNVNTGYVSVADSVAVVLLNSNFNTLSVKENEKQQTWYDATMKSLDGVDSIKAVIVACHHSPYSNSKIVKCSQAVQKSFVQAYIQSKKARLFISGHAHAFEHFYMQGKDFLVIGGGGGIHQPLNSSATAIKDEAADYKPMFHYLSVTRMDNKLSVTSHFLKPDFAGFDIGKHFTTNEHSDVVVTYGTKEIPVTDATSKGSSKTIFK